MKPYIFSAIGGLVAGLGIVVYIVDPKRKSHALIGVILGLAWVGLAILILLTD